MTVSSGVSRGVARPALAPAARRLAYLVLGGALLLPFAVLAVLVAALVPDLGSRYAVDAVVMAVVVVVALPGFGSLDAVQSLELTAARELLSVPGLPPAPRTGTARRRVAAWFTAHVVLGALAACLLVSVPVALLAIPREPLLAIPGLVAGPALALLIGAGVARWAPVALGPAPEERIRLLEAREQDLTRRQALAREVHDSVGHALSVVTLQAEAAGHVFDRDPEFARSALQAVAETARTALVELDHVLALLADDNPEILIGDDDLVALVERTRRAGIEVSAELAEVPEALRHDVFRVVQEGVTNAVRHGGGRVRVGVAEVAGSMEIDVVNPLGPGGTRGSGRGLAGLVRRVEARGGTVGSGVEGENWCLRVRIPR